VNIKLALIGIEQFQRTVKLQDAKTRAATIGAVERSTKRTEGVMRAIVPVRSGEMLSTIRDEYSAARLTGYVRVGDAKLPRRKKYTGAGNRKMRKRKVKIGKGSYAPVIDRGDPRRHIAAQHFTDRAMQATRDENIADIAKALASSTKDGL
jgi:hypothetical protein